MHADVVPFYTAGKLVQWRENCNNNKWQDTKPPTVACNPDDKTEGLCVPLSAEHQKENEENNVLLIIFICICMSPVVACHMKRKKMGCFAPKQGAAMPGATAYVAAQ